MNQLNEAIRIVGKRRFIILASLLAVNLVLGGIWQNWLMPKNQEVMSRSTAVQAERSSLQNDIIQLPIKHIELLAKDKTYVALQAKGLSSVQDRIEARTRIDRLRGQSGLRGITYKIDPQSTVQDTKITDTSNDIISSRIEVQMKSLTDNEMRLFIDKMHEEFGALVVARKFKFARSTPLNDANLLQLSRKEPVDFVTGDVTFEWYSIIPKPPEANAGQAMPGRAQGMGGLGGPGGMME